MRKRQKKIISVSGSICNKDTCTFTREVVEFFRLTKDKFPNILHELAY